MEGGAQIRGRMPTSGFGPLGRRGVAWMHRESLPGGGCPPGGHGVGEGNMVSSARTGEAPP